MLKTFILLFLTAFIGTALAADNSVILTPGTGVTMRTKDVGAGVELPLSIPGDTSGNALATAPGSGNASFALPIQGVASGVAVPISGAVTTSLNTTPSLANGNGVVPTQGGTALSATNGAFNNVLQGNAVLSATNGLYSNLLQGNAVLSTTNPIPNTPVPTTTGGLTTFFLQPTASTNSTSVKASAAGQVYWILAENNSATVNYVRFYNSAGAPTCSSATGLVTQIQIPANTAVGGVNIALPFGIPFSSGIGICVTSGYATTDTTNATATAISLTIGYN